MTISDVHCLGYDWYACRFRKLDVFPKRCVQFWQSAIRIWFSNYIGLCVCVCVQGHFKFKSLKLGRNALEPLPTEYKNCSMSYIIPQRVTANSAPLQVQITGFYVSTSVPSHRKLELRCLHISAPFVCQCKCPVLRRVQFAHRCGLGSIICTPDSGEEDRILVYVKKSRTGKERTSACWRLWALSRSGNCCALMPMLTWVCRRVVLSDGENGLYTG